ncbi:MAG: glycosyltransferase family 2 protein [Paracoccaceae bacterium]
MKTEEVTGYRFRPSDLKISARKPGISAFLRCRNAADFIEAAIRSHMPFFDEIVAVYNRCEDETPRILERLADEFSPRIRVFHYLDTVHPVGSSRHAQTPAQSPNSIVTYYNFSLAQTRYAWAAKLDDDHLAIPSAFDKIVRPIRAGQADPRVHYCFSGLNVARTDRGGLGVPAVDPVAGSGDHGFFKVSQATHFFHDPRFERFAHATLKRRFSGFCYWHLKYLKDGHGFRNYDLSDNPNSRYLKKKTQFESSGVVSLSRACQLLRPGAPDWLAALLNEKARLKRARNAAAQAAFPDASIEAALDRLSPGWRAAIGIDPQA